MSIKLKIIFSVVLTEAILLLILVGSLYQYSKSTNEQALYEYATITERLLMTTTKDAIISYDLATLESYLEEALKNETIIYIRITDIQTNLLAAAGNQQALNKAFTVDEYYHDVNDGIFDRRVSVDIDGTSYGNIDIGFDIAEFEQSLQQLLGIAGTIVTIELVLVVIFSCLIGSLLTKQLEILRNAAKNIANADYSKLVKVKGRDEVADVAHAFNSMILNLRRTVKQSDNFQAELLTLNKELEDRVARRTQKITAQKDKLETAYQKLSITKEQLIKSEKMASIGQLAAGVAHEINNPIAFIKGNLNSLKQYIQTYKVLLGHYNRLLDEIPEHENLQKQREAIKTLEQEEDVEFINEDIENLLNESIDGTARVQDIVKGLKTYSHSSDDTLEPIDINNCLEDTLKMLNNEIKYQCDVITKFGELPNVNANRGQIIQVFTNLIVNAGHAMETHGTLTVLSRLVDNETPKMIEIIVEDTGKGIPEEHLSKLFDPFFTTKPVGQGTGLGLSISQGIIEDHKGTLSVESKVGVGTRFTIQLPTHCE